MIHYIGWLLGPIDDGSYLPLGLGQTVSFKDMIMRTNSNSASGCEPVFVDKYGFCIGVAPATGNTNSLFIDPTQMYNVTAGMNVTGYNGAATAFGPTLVTSVGTLDILGSVSYYQGFDTVITPPQYFPPIDLYLRTFEDPNSANVNLFNTQFSKMHDHGATSLGGAGLGQEGLPGLDANGNVQTNIIQLLRYTGPGLPPPMNPSLHSLGFVVGATVDSTQFFSGGTIVSIESHTTYGSWLMQLFGTGSVTYIITVDLTNATNFDPTIPTPNPNATFGPPGWDAENNAYNILPNCTAYYDPADIYPPNNIIDISLFGASGTWLDEVYNVLWNANGSQTYADLRIGCRGSQNFPPDSCVDPNFCYSTWRRIYSANVV